MIPVDLTLLLGQKLNKKFDRDSILESLLLITFDIIRDTFRLISLSRSNFI